MEILKNYREAPPEGPGSALTIGNFDGVHLGHRALLNRVVSAGNRESLVPTVLTFEPHPARVLGGRPAPPLLTTRADKRRLLASAGIMRLIEQPFTLEWAAQSPEVFVREVLVDALRCRRVVVGYDFVFGARRGGTLETLIAAGRRFDFAVEVIEALAPGEAGVVSSSRIREAIAAGEVERATALLGRPYHLEGRVVRGAQRGRQLGYPTANLQGENELVPPAGVYAGWLDWGETPRMAAISVGTNPTFGDTGLTVEAHVLREQLEPGTDLYGRECHLAFGHCLRGQVRFSGPDALTHLVAQIEADVQETRRRLTEAVRPESLGPGSSWAPRAGTP